MRGSTGNSLLDHRVGRGPQFRRPRSPPCSCLELLEPTGGPGFGGISFGGGSYERHDSIGVSQSLLVRLGAIGARGGLVGSLGLEGSHFREGSCQPYDIVGVSQNILVRICIGVL